MKRIFTLLVLALLGFGSLYAQNIQFIDNIGDPSVTSVNVYFVWTATAGGGGGTREVADSVIGATFRTASTFLPITGEGWIYTVYIVPTGGGVTSADTASGTIIGTVGPINTANYAVIASGLLATDTSTYAPNPSGLSSAISLSVDSGALLQSASSSRTDVAFFNGVSDALPLLVNFNPQTSSSAFPPANLFAPAPYGSYSATGNIDLAEGDYFFSLFDTYGNTYGYYFLTLISGESQDTAGIFFTSGFVDSIDIANGGAPFGLYVATAGGNVHQISSVYPAFVQVINDVADTSAKELEVIIADANSHTVFNEQTLNFASAIPYLPVAAEDSFIVALGPAGDTSLADAFAIFGVSPLYPATFNVYIADGLQPADSADYPANPEGNSRALSLYWHAGVAVDTIPHTAALLYFQGAIDAPTLDVSALSPDSVTLVTNIQYGGYNGYQVVDSANFVIQLTDSAGATVIQTYYAPLALAVGYGAIAFTGGFLDSAIAVPFALYGTFPNGTTLPLSTYTGINTVQALNNIQLYPNPSANNVVLSFSLANETHVQYSLLNTLGQQMQYMDLGNLAAGTNTVNFDVAKLSSGIYLLNLTLDNNTHITRTVEVNR